MSAKIDIRESESGFIRVFQLDLPAQAVERFTVQAGTGEWPLKYGLGATELDAHFVDVIDLRDLGGMSLSAYMAEAYGIPKSNLHETAPMLDALKGHIVILSSRAFARRAQTLTVQTPLRWIATYEEQKGKTITPPLRSKGAKAVSKAAAAGGATNSSVLRWVLIGLAGIALVAVLAGLMV